MPILNTTEAMRLDLGSNIGIDRPAREQRFTGPAEIPHGKVRYSRLTTDPIANPMTDGVLDHRYGAITGKEPFTPEDLGFMDSPIEYELSFR